MYKTFEKKYIAKKQSNLKEDESDILNMSDDKKQEAIFKGDGRDYFNCLASKNGFKGYNNMIDSWMEKLSS